MFSGIDLKFIKEVTNLVFSKKTKISLLSFSGPSYHFYFQTENEEGTFQANRKTLESGREKFLESIFNQIERNKIPKKDEI